MIEWALVVILAASVDEMYIATRAQTFADRAECAAYTRDDVYQEFKQMEYLADGVTITLVCVPLIIEAI